MRILERMLRMSCQTLRTGSGLGSSAAIKSTRSFRPRRVNPRRKSSLDGKVAEERPRRDSGRFGDLFHRDLPEATLGEEFPGDLLVSRLEQAPPPAPTGLVRRDRHGRNPRAIHGERKPKRIGAHPLRDRKPTAETAVVSLRSEVSRMKDELTWMAAWRIRELMVKREISALEVTDHFLARIENSTPSSRRSNMWTPKGHGTRQRRLDARAGEHPGPLHGIPISVKEHIAVAGMPLMALFGDGRRAHRALRRPRGDPPAISGSHRRRDQHHDGYVGARSVPVQLGTRGPQPLGPFPRTRMVEFGGAATAAARLLPIAIGTDGGGSTRLPGAYSGVVGMHPTAGLVPGYSPA